MIELLAPVGSREALVAAVESGADAVYLAGKMFGARAYAANFSNEELAEAVKFAHLRGVKVHVAVNTLVDNSELPSVVDYLVFLHNSGVDAIIVQDLGVAGLARQVAPELPLHASTQLTVHNLAGVEMMARLGFERVVLAREMSLADIRSIVAAAPVEIEIFVHGALCICYSGQCLMSSMIGGRSGNRGRCAQPCRLPYTLIDGSGRAALSEVDCGEYLLSPKDFNALELLPDIIEAGVASLKIEGRMKRPEYVAVVVDTYRRAIDDCYKQRKWRPAERDQKDLAQIFNRDFTTAYLLGNPGRTMMSDRRPNNRGVFIGRVAGFDYQNKEVTIKLAEDLAVGDTIEFWVKVGGRVNVTIKELRVGGKAVTAATAGQSATFALPNPVRVNDRAFKVFDAALMSRARCFFNSGAAVRRIGVTAAVTAIVGQPLTISLTSEDGCRAEASTQFIAEPARNRPLTAETVRKQLQRMGDSVYDLRELICDIASDVMVPVSEINETRRRAVRFLDDMRLKRCRRNAVAPAALPPDETSGMVTRRLLSLCVRVDTLAKAQAALASGADAIVFGGDSFERKLLGYNDYRQAWELTKQAGKKFIADTPRIIGPEAFDQVIDLLNELAALPVDAVNIHNIALLAWRAEGCQIPVNIDASMNMYNDMAIRQAMDLGGNNVTLSPELNFTQLAAIAGHSAAPLECIVQGHLELMVSQHCLIGGFLGGAGAGSCGQPCRQGRYYLKDRKEEIFPVVTDQYCRMHVLNGKELTMLKYVDKFKNIGIASLRIEGKFYSAAQIGTVTKQYRELIDGVTLADGVDDGGMSITRGHYFRGVL